MKNRERAKCKALSVRNLTKMKFESIKSSNIKPYMDAMLYLSSVVQQHKTKDGCALHFNGFRLEVIGGRQKA